MENKIRYFMSSNIGIKLLALVLATILWFFVDGSQVGESLVSVLPSITK